MQEMARHFFPRIEPSSSGASDEESTRKGDRVELVTAVSEGYLDRLRWSLPTWRMKPQFAVCPLLIFVGPGIRKRDLAWVSDYFAEVRLVPWSMPAAESRREEMLTAFVLGAAKHVRDDHFIKLDADTYCVDSQDVFSSEHFGVDLVSQPWGYTKPGWWHDALEAWAVGEIETADEYRGNRAPGSRKASRIISYCCLHRTDFIRRAAAAAGERLPVPSHDTYLWWIANQFTDCTWATVNTKERGIRYQHNARKMREDICARECRWQHTERLNNIQLEITTACDLACPNCDRCCGIAPSAERMTVEQVRAFVDESLSSGRQWSRIDIIGGEPTLHPQLAEICAEIGRYRERHKCKVRISTNGVGPQVAKRLAAIPEWVKVRDSNKEAGAGEFETAQRAPLDVDPKYDAGALACSIPWRCGLALTRNGYYLCGAGASIDRVFRLGVAAHTVADLLRNANMQQLALCKLCGHSRSTVKTSREQVTSKTWAAALEAYNGRLEKGKA